MDNVIITMARNIKYAINYKNDSELKAINEKYRKPFMDLKDSKSGRCFIIGNGPSLRLEDLQRLREEETFAFNGIFEIFKDIGWKPKYYMCQDGEKLKLSDDQFREISEGADKVFLNATRYKYYPGFIKARNNVYIYHVSHIRRISGSPKFSEDISFCIYEGNTVAYSAIQVAAYMGFTEIYLLGVDHSYSVTKDRKGKLIYDSSVQDYCGALEAKNQKLTIGSLYQSTLAYEAANRFAQNHGIRIFNATRGGKLEAFERVDFDSIRL